MAPMLYAHPDGYVRRVPAGTTGAQWNGGGVATIFGACSAPGGTTKGVADGIVTKWGVGCYVRQFHTTNLGVLNVDSDYGIMHASYKPGTIAAINAGTYDAAFVSLANAAAAAPCEVWLEIEHEADKGVREGDATYANMVLALNRFYDVVHTAQPTVKTATTYTGWVFNGSLNYMEWGAVKADVLGVDLDGIHDDDADGIPEYTNYQDNIDRVMTLFAANPTGTYQHVAAPEFGAERPDDNSDPTGSVRTAWMQDLIDRMIEEEFYGVAYFDRDQSGRNYLLTPGMPEYDLWASYCPIGA